MVMCQDSRLEGSGHRAVRFTSRRILGGGFSANPRTNRSEEHTSELQSHLNLVCRLLLEKTKDTAFQVYSFSSLYTDLFFFFNDTATTEIYTLSLHDALPI